MCVIEILGEILDSHPEGERWKQAYRLYRNRRDHPRAIPRVFERLVHEGFD